MNLNPEKLIKALDEMPSLGNTSLDAQIKFVEWENSVMLTPVRIAIIQSLKELKAIKAKNIASA